MKNPTNFVIARMRLVVGYKFRHRKNTCMVQATKLSTGLSTACGQGYPHVDKWLSTGLRGLWITFFTFNVPDWLARLTRETYVVPMTYTAADHAAAIAHASESQRDSARDGGLADYLLERQQGMCFDCNEAPATEFAHFVRAKGRTTRGMHVLGAMACRRCNLKHDRICDAMGTDGTLPYAYLSANGRAERVVTAYETRTDLVARHAARMAAYEADLAAEVAAEIEAMGM